MSDLQPLLVCWLLLAAIVFLAARSGGLLGIFGGHLVATVLAVVLDQCLIQSDIHGRGDPPEPLGLFQIVLINAVLVPASTVGCLIRLLRQIPH